MPNPKTNHLMYCSRSDVFLEASIFALIFDLACDQVTISEKFIDEFEDVSHEEKLFMKLWNRHVRAPTVVPDARVREHI